MINGHHSKEFFFSKSSNHNFSNQWISYLTRKSDSDLIIVCSINKFPLKCEISNGRKGERRLRKTSRKNFDYLYRFSFFFYLYCEFPGTFTSWTQKNIIAWFVFIFTFFLLFSIGWRENKSTEESKNKFLINLDRSLRSNDIDLQMWILFWKLIWSEKWKS